jgi:hypothetical protein
MTAQALPARAHKVGVELLTETASNERPRPKGRGIETNVNCKSERPKGREIRPEEIDKRGLNLAALHAMDAENR